MDIDVTQFLAAILENEGGEYVLPFDAFNAIVESEGKALAIDPTDGGTTITLKLVNTADITLEDENE